MLQLAVCGITTGYSSVFVFLCQLCNREISKLVVQLALKACFMDG